jgi:hypothetical protein
MTPDQALSSLDSQLAAHGQKITLRRYTAPSGTPRPKTELIDIPAFVRAVKADEIVGNIDATFSNVTLSPTDIILLWPIVKGDKLVIDGRERNVDLPKPKKLGDVLVRCDLVVAG